MRLIALDTETTGMNKKRMAMADVAVGHRIIEIGAVEIRDGRITGRQFHRYIEPGCEVDVAATKIHGLTNEFLEGKPKFEDIVEELLDFIGDDEVIIHNAAFDIAFLDKEFKLLNRRLQPSGKTFIVTDTLSLARSMFPGQDNTLNGLGDRYGIEGRTRHGALIDAIILAKIYLMINKDVFY